MHFASMIILFLKTYSLNNTYFPPLLPPSYDKCGQAVRCGMNFPVVSIFKKDPFLSHSKEKLNKRWARVKI